MISNRRIQSVLAKAITDVGYIGFLKETGQQDAALIAPLQQGKKNADLRSIVRFSAFISKVQHNFLWTDFPGTFKLIHNCSLEIDIFSAYLPAHQENKRYKLSFDEKTERFASFLESYLAYRRTGKFRLLYYIFRHENHIFRLKQKAKELEPVKSSQAGGLFSPQSVVKINGEIRMQSFPVVPEKMMQRISEGKQPSLSGKIKWYAYWLNAETKTVETMAVDDQARILIGYIGNNNTLEEVLKKAARRIGEKTASNVLLFLLKNNIILLKKR